MGSEDHLIGIGTWPRAFSDGHDTEVCEAGAEADISKATPSSLFLGKGISRREKRQRKKMKGKKHDNLFFDLFFSFLSRALSASASPE